MNNWLKIILGVLGTIILGAIGSGLWERFLSGFFDTLVSLSVELVNLLFKTYKDGIYETASLGFHESYSFMWLLLVISALPLAYINLLKKHPASKKENSEFENKAGTFMRSEKGYILISLLTLVAMVLCLFIMTKMSYTNRVVTYSMRSIDIVKPFISSHEHNMLVSQYYQIRTTDDFMNFNKTLTEIAKNNELRLPENDPL